MSDCLKISTPLGEIVLVSDGTALCWVGFEGQKCPASPADWLAGKKNEVLLKASRELELYFAGELREFSVPLRPAGTPFQERVWEKIAAIPYGRLASYGEIAGGLGTGARAVGSATGSNPISIFIPCHRVVGYDGAITGYGGGLDRKRALLTLEGISVIKDLCSEVKVS